jgi:hypothetical protein
MIKDLKLKFNNSFVNGDIQPYLQPSTQSSTQPSTQSSTQPSTQSSTQPSTQSSTQPSTQSSGCFMYSYAVFPESHQPYESLGTPCIMEFPNLNFNPIAIDTNKSSKYDVVFPNLNLNSIDNNTNKLNAHIRYNDIVFPKLQIIISCNHSDNIDKCPECNDNIQLQINI